jgi:hypothetical protein
MEKLPCYMPKIRPYLATKGPNIGRFNGGIGEIRGKPSLLVNKALIEKSFIYQCIRKIYVGMLTIRNKNSKKTKNKKSAIHACVAL